MQRRPTPLPPPACSLTPPSCAPFPPRQSEYPPDNYARRAYISNFDGSAGTAVVTMDKAALWTDGRYFLQVRWAR
jgi:hypothetical protein